MTYNIFTFLVSCDDGDTLNLLASKHAEIADRCNKGNFSYDCSTNIWGQSTLTIAPPWQESTADYMLGFNSLIDQSFEELWRFDDEIDIKLSLQMDVMHDGQCNLEFGPEFAKQLSGFQKIGFLISCYENPELVEEIEKKLSIEGRA